MLTAVKSMCDGEIVVSFVEEEMCSGNADILVNFDELEDFVCEGNEIPIGYILIHNGVIIVHETGEIEFVKFGDNKILKISA